jgi:putative acetyltransferase
MLHGGFPGIDRPEMRTVTLRPYTAADEDAAIELWRRTWAHHFPHIDFNARVAWWRERWRQELIPVAHVVLAELDGKLAGFVTVDPDSLYLDQLVVAPEHWGSDAARALLDEAKRLSPHGLDLMVNKDNARAIRFYEKHGFAFAGEGKNPASGLPVNRMRWRAP